MEGVWKIGVFRRISRFISKTVQDTTIVTIEDKCVCGLSNGASSNAFNSVFRDVVPQSVYKELLNYILSYTFVLLEIVAPSFRWFLVVIWWWCPAGWPSLAYVVLYVNSSTNSSCQFRTEYMVPWGRYHRRTNRWFVQMILCRDVKSIGESVGLQCKCEITTDDAAVVRRIRDIAPNVKHVSL